MAKDHIGEYPANRSIWAFIKSPSGAAILGLAGLISGLALGVYGLVAERQAQLKVALVSLSTVFDLHQPVGGLDVFYEGKSLRSTKKSLWSMSLVLSNTGTAGLRRVDFDERSPFIVEIVDGEVVDEPAKIMTLDYLKEGVRFNVTRSSLVFEPFILDASDSFQISLVILSNQGTQPTIKTRGKIAGLKKIDVNVPDVPNIGITLATRIFAADTWWIQAARGITYGTAFILSSILIGVITTGLLAILMRAKNSRKEDIRRREIEKYRSHFTENNEEANTKLSEIYIKDGNESLASAARLRITLKERNLLAQRLDCRNFDLQECTMLCRRRFPSYPGDRWIFRKLEAAGLASQRDGLTVLSPALEKALDELITFLGKDVFEAEARLREYWAEEDVRLIPAEILKKHGAIA